MTGIRRMPCIQTFIVRQRVIGELPDSIHNVVPKRADIGQITVLNAVVVAVNSIHAESGGSGAHGIHRTGHWIAQPV